MSTNASDAQSTSLRMTAPPQVPVMVVDEKNQRPGQSWKQHEVHEIPHNDLRLVFPGLMVTVFLGALDQTIVATALPTIIRDLGGSDGYSWVGTAYLLMASCLGPLYGKLSDIVGRKPVLYTSIAIFLGGSALCGAAQSFIWLVLARGMQGIGGGGISQLVQITISDITPLEKRGIYTGFIGAVWGFASVFGPLVGGVLTDHASWRWIFWINLPTGGIAALLLICFLKLNPVKQKTFHQHVTEFDFIGLGLLMSGIVLLLLGFNAGEKDWSSRNTIIFLTIGCVLLVAGGINEARTNRSPIIPPRLFKTRTTLGVLLSTFLHSFVFFGVSYYGPVYFQVLGASATKSGVQMIPFSFGMSLVAVVAGFILVRIGAYRPVIWFGWVVMLLGQGLMIMFDEKTSLASQEIILLVSAVGVGCLFHPPLIALQSAMPLDDMATATATFALIRQIGGTIGISVGGAIYASETHRRLQAIGFTLTDELRGLSHIQPLDVRNKVLHAYTASVSTIWIVWTPLVFVGLLFVIPMREYTLKRRIVRNRKAGADTNAATTGVEEFPSSASVSDVEKGPIEISVRSYPKDGSDTPNVTGLGDETK